MLKSHMKNFFLQYRCRAGRLIRRASSLAFAVAIFGGTSPLCAGLDLRSALPLSNVNRFQRLIGNRDPLLDPFARRNRPFCRADRFARQTLFGPVLGDQFLLVNRRDFQQPFGLAMGVLVAILGRSATGQKQHTSSTEKPNDVRVDGHRRNRTFWLCRTKYAVLSEPLHKAS